MNAYDTPSLPKSYSDQNQLLRILIAVSSVPQDSFFQELTRALTTVCEVSGAFISEFMLDADRARVVAGTVNELPLKSVEYDLSGTPCEETLTNGICVYGEGVTRRYPNHLGLRELQADAFIAILLTSHSGDPLGTLGVINNAPIPETDAMLGMLEHLATVVARRMEQRQRESAIRRSEARFRLMAEYSKDILFYQQIRPTANIEYINPAVEEITGYPPEAFQANATNALSVVHEEDRHRVEGAITSGSEEPILARLVRPDGDIRWVEYHNFPFRDDQNHLVAMGGSIRDVTRQVQAEEALRLSESYRRALLEAVPDTIFRLDATGVLLDYVSGDFIGTEFQTSESIGKNIKEVMSSSVSGRVRHLSQLALRSGECQRLEFEVASEGESRFLEARCMPFGQGEVLFMLRDFTAIKWHEAEADRRKLRDELDMKIEKRVAPDPYGLTYREMAVLHLVAQGFADKQIAEALGISFYTVNKHVGNIRGKMNAASRTEAGVRAIREGLLES